MNPAITDMTLFLDIFGAILLVGALGLWLLFGYRNGDLALLARWVRSWLPANQQQPAKVVALAERRRRAELNVAMSRTGQRS